MSATQATPNTQRDQFYTAVCVLGQGLHDIAALPTQHLRQRIQKACRSLDTATASFFCQWRRSTASDEPSRCCCWWNPLGRAVGRVLGGILHGEKQSGLQLVLLFLREWRACEVWTLPPHTLSFHVHPIHW